MPVCNSDNNLKEAFQFLHDRGKALAIYYSTKVHVMLISCMHKLLAQCQYGSTIY